MSVNLTDNYQYLFFLQYAGYHKQHDVIKIIKMYYYLNN